LFFETLNKKKRRAMGMVQVVEHLPSKHKALSSSPILKEEEQEKKEQVLNS
jgi:hypothetical protein